MVDTTGFNEDFWFTNGGLPHTEALKLTERFTRPDLDTLKYDLTIDDAGAYTKPWKLAFDINWTPNGEILEYVCQENNLWMQRLLKQKP